MKKQWIRCLAAVSLIVTIGTGAGTVLKAHGEEMAGKSGGDCPKTKIANTY